MPRKLNVATTVLFTNDPTINIRPVASFTTDHDLLYSNDSATVITDMRDFLSRVAAIKEYVLVMAEIAMPDGTMQEGGGVFSSWDSALECVTSGKSIVTITEDRWGNFLMTTVTADGSESHFRFKTLTIEGVTYYKRRPYEPRKDVVAGLLAAPPRLNSCRLSEKLQAASQKNVKVAQAA